jgi:hypothetical protein
MNALSHILDALLPAWQEDTKVLNEGDEVPIFYREVFVNFRKQESSSTELYAQLLCIKVE